MVSCPSTFAITASWAEAAVVHRAAVALSLVYVAVRLLAWRVSSPTAFREPFPGSGGIALFALLLVRPLSWSG